MTARDPMSTTPSRGGRRALVGGVLLFAVLLAAGTVPRLMRDRELSADVGARAAAVPVVTVIEAKRAATVAELTLPGAVQGLHETQLYARTNGFMRRGIAEMGSKVRAGQQLAVIETPELDQELAQNRSTLKQAEAQRELARQTLARWEQLVPQGAATRQELDDKRGAFNVAEANASAVRSNVQRLGELKRFARITAPFAGVVTARTVDVGALVSSATTAASGARGLFSLAQIDSMRISVNVPQTYVASIVPGQTASVSVQELGGVVFRGRVARTSSALDPATRTLLTQIEVANPASQLLPGMYAQVRFSASRANPPFLIPANALIVRSDGPQVATVGADGRVHVRKVQLGRDYGSEVEIVSGLEEHTMVIVNPSDDVVDGAVVKALPAQRADK
ncbi:MAG: efflux RND transporter periplasmic adaptor subunit [Gemmatimonadaceae bacterium]